jgi:hypothetical protein
VNEDDYSPATENDASALNWMTSGTVERRDPTQLGKPSYYDDLPALERNQTPKDRTVSVLLPFFGILPWLRAGIEADNRGESFWSGGSEQYDREVEALRRYYADAYEGASDKVKALAFGGPVGTSLKVLTAPLVAAPNVGATQVGAFVRALIQPDQKNQGQQK